MPTITEMIDCWRRSFVVNIILIIININHKYGPELTNTQVTGKNLHRHLGIVAVSLELEQKF